MPAYVSVLFSEPMPADTLAVIAPPETPPADILMSVARAFDHLGIVSGADPVPAQIAEEAVERLLGVVTGLTMHCPSLAGDETLFEGIEVWLANRGRF